MKGCDVPGYLSIQNCTEDDAYYLTYYKSPEGIIDTVILEIKPNETIGKLFGFGQHWTELGINDYLSQINKIEVITNTDTVSMTDKQEMYEYFRKRRRGLFNQIMKIKIE